MYLKTTGMAALFMRVPRWRLAPVTGLWARCGPRVIAYLGCDMVYGEGRITHFYGRGMADPLRPDPTLQNLRAKAARLELLAARDGCALVNLSADASVLTFPRVDIGAVGIGHTMHGCCRRISPPRWTQSAS